MLLVLVQDCTFPVNQNCLLSLDRTVKDPTIGVIPFLDIQLPAGKRFTFTVEFGTGFNDYKTREVIHTENEIRTFKDQGFEISIENFINDITIFYNF